MNNGFNISLIIPCYNEYKNLNLLLNEIEVLNSTSNIEVIIVNNGSTDESAQYLNKKHRARFKLVSVHNNLGYGYGVKAGINASSGELIIIIHGDLELNLVETFEKISSQLRPDMFIKGIRVRRTIRSKFFSLLMALLASIYFKRLLYDINAQPTVFPRNLLMDVNKLPDDFLFDLAVYLNAKNNKIHISRIRVFNKARIHGISSWNRGLISQFNLGFKILKGFKDLKKIN
jgi:glycosyltransferase involved in cell wall biosynthesis